MKHTANHGMDAIALTDHGNMLGAVNFYNTAKKNNIKPLMGCEVYLVIDHKNTERPKKGRVDADGNDVAGGFGLQNKIYHMGLLAQNNEGYQNLIKLVSDAHQNGFYYKPRTDIEQLAKYSKGLIGFSGCLAGVIPQHLVRGDEEGARKWLERFIEIFGKDRFIIEVQDHGIPEQRKIIPPLLKMAKDYGLLAICSNDSHYVEEGDHIAHDILLCIQTGAKLADANRFKFDINEFFVKTPKQMETIFGERKDLLTNTRAVADMCEVELDFKTNHYPTFKMSVELTEKWGSNVKMLWGICDEGLKKHYGVSYDIDSPDKQTKELSARLKYEIEMIDRMGFVDYFLIVADFIEWDKQQDIPVGPGRGSGAGSLVAYCTGITNIDPIRFKLFFERFLNPERVSPPDFDIDFCMRRREEVVEYVRRRYGNDHVANIVTYGTFGAKMVIRDICRVKDIPFAEANRIAKMVPEGLNPKSGKNWTLEAAAEIPEFAAELKSSPLAQEIYKQGSIIEGMVRSTGKHAAGIIITEKPVTDYVPIIMQEGAMTTQYDKNQVEDLGLLKMDFLGLKTLTVIADAQKNVRAKADPNFDIEKLPLDDPGVYELIASGRTPAVFQLESAGMQATCRQVQISNIDDINAVLALYRPGPMQFIPKYAEGKKDPSKVEYPHPLLEEVLAETYGIIVYQEQVMEAAKILAGYTLGGADILRRAMGKKKIEEMDRQRKIFVEGCKKTNNIPEARATEIFAILEKFASYGFNKAHSMSYALLSYQTAYLKAHYPVEFMAAVLSSELGNADNVAKFIGECSAMGLDVLGPDVNESGINFTPAKGKIRFGMGAIKGVGEGASARIIEEREANGHFKNFTDFAKRMDGHAVNKRVVEGLVKAGAFDNCGDERAYLIANYEDLLKTAHTQDVNQGMLFDLFDMPGVDEPIGNANVEPLPFQEKLRYENELLGFYVSGHPLDEFTPLNEAIDTTVDPKSVEDKKHFRVCGVISNVTKRFSKRDNQPWAFFNFSTKQYRYEMSMFSQAYAQHGHQLQEGAVVVLVGQARNQNDEMRFTVEQVMPLRENLRSMIKKVSFVLDCEHESALEYLQELKDILINQHNGDCGVQVLCAKPDDQGQMKGPLAALPESLRWSIDLKQLMQMREHPAVHSIRAIAEDFVPPQRKWTPRKKEG